MSLQEPEDDRPCLCDYGETCNVCKPEPSSVSTMTLEEINACHVKEIAELRSEIERLKPSSVSVNYKSHISPQEQLKLSSVSECKPEWYYKGLSGTIYKAGVDPEVTCWKCGKTFLCDPMDASCRLCNAFFRDEPKPTTPPEKPNDYSDYCKAVDKALDNFHEWNNVTGIFQKSTGYMAEVESVIEDAVKIGWQGALQRSPTMDEFTGSQWVDGKPYKKPSVKKCDTITISRKVAEEWYHVYKGYQVHGIAGSQTNNLIAELNLALSKEGK
jgi:hypothetical protein